MAAFVASTWVSERAAGDIHDRTHAISRAALPAIEHLAALRTELFQLELVLERGAREADADALGRALRGSSARLRAEKQAYDQIPVAPTEEPLRRRFSQELAEVQALVDAELQSDGAGTPVRRTPQAPSELQRAEATALALIDDNTAAAETLTRAIERSRLLSNRAAVGLDALSVLLALVVTRLAWRVLREHLDTQEAQRRLLSARAEELEAFSGRVAHDILNPLSAVGLSLQLIQRGVPPEQVVARARASLQRAHRIIDALLAFARAGAKAEPDARCELEPVLAGVVSDAAELAESRGVDLALQVEGPLRVACPAGVLASLAGNLVANAVKYMGPGSGARRVTVRAAGGQGVVRVEVEDTGPGLEPGTLRTIFEPYVRGKGHQETGIGLGLATAKKLSEAHGGRIGVLSVVGRGSTFWFELPEAEPPIAPDPRPGEARG